MTLSCHPSWLFLSLFFLCTIHLVYTRYTPRCMVYVSAYWCMMYDDVSAYLVYTRYTLLCMVYVPSYWCMMYDDVWSWSVDLELERRFRYTPGIHLACMVYVLTYWCMMYYPSHSVNALCSLLWILLGLPKNLECQKQKINTNGKLPVRFRFAVTRDEKHIDSWLVVIWQPTTNTMGYTFKPLKPQRPDLT